MPGNNLARKAARYWGDRKELEVIAKRTSYAINAALPNCGDGYAIALTLYHGVGVVLA